MKSLTNAEERIMLIIWDIGPAYVNDIRACFGDPKPAYNTVSTITRILVKKGFVGFKSYGKTHQYFPLVPKETYARELLHHLLQGYFENSYLKLVSFFSRQDNLSTEEIDELRKLMKEEIKSLKNK